MILLTKVIFGCHVFGDEVVGERAEKIQEAIAVIKKYKKEKEKIIREGELNGEEVSTNLMLIARMRKLLIDVIDERLWSDIEFIYEGMKIDISILEDAADVRKKDYVLMLDAVRISSDAWKYIDNDLREDVGFRLDAYKDDKDKIIEVLKNAMQGSTLDETFFTSRIFPNFKPSTYAHSIKLLDQNIIMAIGEDETYNLIKYYGPLNENALNEIANRKDTFKKYLELRKRFETQPKLQALRTRNAINDFGKSVELIENIVDKELNEKQVCLLEMLLRDKESYPEIKTVQDLENYPKLRKEKYAQRIIEEDKSVVRELIMGLSNEEFENLSSSFSSNIEMTEALKAMYKDVDDEIKGKISEAFIGIKIVETVERILQENPEKGKEILTNFNEELAQEFEGNSYIANIRRRFSKIKDDVRRFFGEELSNALNVPEQEIEKEEIDGIQIMHLKGEKFKILVHAIDPFGYMEENKHLDKREDGKAHICTSLISDEFLERARGKVVVGYTKVNPNAFIQSSANDSYSYANKQDKLDIKADKLIFSQTTDSLLATTAGLVGVSVYNEVNLYRECEDENGNTVTMIPNYIVCFDAIDEKSKEEARLIAKSYGLEKPLPILLVHTDRYASQIKDFKEASKKNIGLTQFASDKEVLQNTRARDMLESAAEIASHEEILEAAMEIVNATEISNNTEIGE